MKRAIFILAFILSLSPLTIMAQWNYVGSAGISGGWTLYNKIDIDATTGFPVIVFNERDIDKAVCLRYNGIKWESVGDSTFQNFPVGDIIDFKIDKKNNYNLLFYHHTNYNSSCIRFDGNTWKYVGSQYITENYCMHNTIGIDTSGIAYFVMNLKDDPYIFIEDSNAWQIISAEGLVWLNYPKLKFDNDNIPILAYNDGYTYCSKFINNKWEPVGNSKVSNLFPSEPNLHITQDNDYYISFYDSGTRCFKLNKSSNKWELVGKADSELEKLDGRMDVASDSESNIYLVSSYFNGENYNALCYSFKGDKWQQLGNAPVSETETGYLGLAFSEKKRKLYCTYNDWGTGKAVVKEYSLSTGIYSENQNNLLKVYPNPTTGDFFIEVPGEKFNVEIYNIKGAQIFSYKNNYNKVEIKESSLKKGIYLVKIATENNNLLYKKLVII